MSNCTIAIAALATVWTGTRAVVYHIVTVRTHVLLAFIRQDQSRTTKSASPSNKPLPNSEGISKSCLIDYKPDKGLHRFSIPAIALNRDAFLFRKLLQCGV